MIEFATEQGGLSSDVIRKAFNATEEEFLHLVRSKFPARPQIAAVGSCCLVGAISNDVLYVANLGDSRAVLGKRDAEGQGARSPVTAERLSTDHNVAVEEVRREVEAMHPEDSHMVVYTRGVWRIKGIIQVRSRCPCPEYQPFSMPVTSVRSFDVQNFKRLISVVGLDCVIQILF